MDGGPDHRPCRRDSQAVAQGIVGDGADRDRPETAQGMFVDFKNVVGTHGVYNLSPANHNGLDERARVLVHVVNGEWRLMK